MVTPENKPEDLEKLLSALGENPNPPRRRTILPTAKGEMVCTIRKALFSPHEVIAADQALGRICGMPTVSCPPAIPIAVSGERITADMLTLFHHYGIETIDVLK